MFGTTRSGKTYRNEGKGGLEYSPLISPPQGDEEDKAKVSLWSAIKLIWQGFSWIPPPPTPPLTSPPSHPTSPIPLPPSPQFSMENTVKLPLFKGLGNEDPDQFWFVVRVVWEVQHVTDDHIKKATLVSSLQDHVLTWYIKYSNDNPNARVEGTQIALNREFNRHKSKAQSIVRFKEITMQPGEMPCELDQRLKCAIHEANMNLTDGQHCKWFVASLLSHLRVTLSQQKITTQVEVLEIAIRLHETPMQGPNLGV